VSTDQGQEPVPTATPEIAGRVLTPTYHTEYLRLDADHETPVQVCDLCGSLVLFTSTHTDWHSESAPARTPSGETS
jgi:hypothetical protein